MPIFFHRATASFCAAVLLFLAASAGAGEPDRAFSPGEKLTFQIKWGPFRREKPFWRLGPWSGEATRPSDHFVMEVKTNAFLDLFYYYRTRFDAYAELQMNRSLHYRQRTKTGRKTKDVTVDFDWQADMAHFHRTETFFQPEPKTNIKTLETPLLPGTFDPLSAFYYTRMLAPQERTLITRPISDGKRTLRASLKVIGRELITLNGRVLRHLPGSTGPQGRQSGF